MSFGVQIDIPILALQDYLKGMTVRLDDFSVPLSKGADLLYADIMAAFDTGGGSIGESWAPLAQSTMERMKYAGGKSGPGFGQGPTGNLLGSIQKFVRPFVMGVEAPVPHAHLFESGHLGLVTAGPGGPKKRSHPSAPGAGVEPPREFMKIIETTEQAIIDLIMDYAVEEQAA